MGEWRLIFAGSEAFSSRDTLPSVLLPETSDNALIWPWGYQQPPKRKSLIGLMETGSFDTSGWRRAVGSLPYNVAEAVVSRSISISDQLLGNSRSHWEAKAARGGMGWKQSPFGSHAGWWGWDGQSCLKQQLLQGYPGLWAWRALWKKGENGLLTRQDFPSSQSSNYDGGWGEAICQCTLGNLFLRPFKLIEGIGNIWTAIRI